MRKKVIGFALSVSGALLFTLCFSALAQQPKKVSRIGFLSTRVKPTPTSPDLFENAFRQGLRDLGYIEGKSILVEYRYAEGVGDRLPGFAAELVQLKVDVLVSAAIFRDPCSQTGDQDDSHRDDDYRRSSRAWANR